MKSALRLVASAIAFLLGLGAVWAGFSLAGAPVDRGGIVERKLAHLAAVGDRYDTLLIGSSRVHRHLDPAVMDRAAAAHGLAMRSFNCAIDGMFAPEDSYMLEQALRRKRTGLRWVLIEISAFLPLPIAKGMPPKREVCWHDWTRTVSACRSTWPADRKGKLSRGKAWRKRREALAKAWPRLEYHVRCFALRTTRLGLGAPEVQRLLGPRAAIMQWPTDGYEGFEPYDTPTTPSEAAIFQKAMANLRAKGALHRLLPEEAQRNLDRMLAAVRGAGAQPILMHTPATFEVIFSPDPKTAVPILDYTDFNKYAELYKPENRKEHAHLNARGAEVFSRIVGEEWARLAR